MKILLTGATGFVGSAVLDHLRSAPESPSMRIIVREPAAIRADRGVEIVRGDLTDPSTLSGVAEGMDVVIHTASYVGSDEATATAVNDLGTRNLAREVRLSGAEMLYVSTTAVYGPGPHRMAVEGLLPVRPVSAASSSRRAGEEHVLAVGGKVVRAALTYGRGDRWFVPTALAGVRSVGGWVGGGTARLSSIHVVSLAEAVAALATRFSTVEETIFHAADANPATFRELVTHVAKHLAIELPDRDIPAEHPALAHLPAQVLQRAYIDHSYSGELLRARTSTGSRAGFHLAAPDLDWYASSIHP